MKKLSFLISVMISVIVLFSYHDLIGQILNADAFGRRSAAKGALQGEIGFGFNLDKEQDFIVEIDNHTDISYRFEKHLLILADRIKFLRSGSESFLNSGFVHFRSRNFLQKKLAPEFFLQYQWDAVRGLKNRALSGSNMRLRLRADSLMNVHVALGLMYEFERWSFTAVPPENRPPDATPIELNRLKINSYLSFSRRVTDNFLINFISYFQTKPDENWDLPRLSISSELKFNIGRHFNFQVTYSSFYDSGPPVPIDKFYFSVGNQFSIHF